MALVLPGGRKFVGPKWHQSDDGRLLWADVDDLNRGTISLNLSVRDDLKVHCRIRHVGLKKLERAPVYLSEVMHVAGDLQSAKQWIAVEVRRLVVNHDKEVTLTPDDYRTLSNRSTAGGHSFNGDTGDFGPAGRRPTRFRTRRRRR